jgi:hypothetical protein
VFALGPLVALLVISELPSAEPTTVEVWAGHFIMRGIRRVPWKGPVPTETQAYVLARVQRQGRHLEIQQHFCRFENKPVKNVIVTVSPAVIAHMKPTPVTIDVAPDGSAKMSPWSLTWGREDMDADGHPGATFTVGGTFCSGDLYSASQATYTPDKVRFSDKDLTGEMKVDQRQQILGASGFCLRAMAGDSNDLQNATFAYRAVPAGTTCASLAGKPWPVQATPPAAPAAK